MKRRALRLLMILPFLPPWELTVCPPTGVEWLISTTGFGQNQGCTHGNPVASKTPKRNYPGLVKGVCQDNVSFHVYGFPRDMTGSKVAGKGALGNMQ
ncbi:hypothetical protein BDV26DRAFT_269238 [Aspergillus bertholletiae]|uniref:Secreted protein n=1 Tax=Aspergillus bertholletiae TaxID=1226010 RepID=A0A5N7B134_9EURO|nr:hypothetical protein BDV26DRAFT_269238 [Aspergillus bertholletiae]